MIAIETGPNNIYQVQSLTITLWLDLQQQIILKLSIQYNIVKIWYFN